MVPCCLAPSGKLQLSHARRGAILRTVGLSFTLSNGARPFLARAPQIYNLSHCPSPKPARKRVAPTTAPSTGRSIFALGIATRGRTGPLSRKVYRRRQPSRPTGRRRTQAGGSQWALYLQTYRTPYLPDPCPS